MNFHNPYLGFKPQGEKNSGLLHRDYDPDEVTSIVDFYRRFAADPNFQVTQLPPVYDLDESQTGTAYLREADLRTESLINAEEPDFGSQDLEYLDQVRRTRKPRDKDRKPAQRATPQDVSEASARHDANDDLTTNVT